MASLLSLAVRPATRTIRRWILNAQLRNTEYHLKHIAEVRRNDYLVERELHKHQVHLVSELRRPEVQ